MPTRVDTTFIPVPDYVPIPKDDPMPEKLGANKGVTFLCELDLLELLTQDAQAKGTNRAQVIRERLRKSFVEES